MSKRTLHVIGQRTGSEAKSTPLKSSLPLAVPSREPAAARARRDGATALSTQERHQLVAQSAYYRAERRGFEPGHELEDWLAAEQDVERLLPRNATKLS